MSSMAPALGELGSFSVAVSASAGAAASSDASVPSTGATRNLRRRRDGRVTGARILQAAVGERRVSGHQPAAGSDGSLSSEGRRRGGRSRGAGSGSGPEAPWAKAAPSPATALIASEAPVGSSSSLFASPAATAGSASRYL